MRERVSELYALCYAYFSSRVVGDQEMKGFQDFQVHEKLPLGRLHHRSELCQYCSNEAARRKAAQLIDQLKAIEYLYGITDWGLLTVTLPGKARTIRRASLITQYEYLSWKRAGRYPVRGLHDRLISKGAFGGITFFEITQNEKTKWWNMHLHVLVATMGPSSELDQEPSEVTWSCCGKPLTQGEDCDCSLLEPVHRKVQGYNDYSYMELGFGPRVSWDPDAEEEDSIAYCTKLAYATKPIQYQNETEDGKVKIHDLPQLGRFFWKSRRMVRAWGKARFSALDSNIWKDVKADYTT
ncbi:MAG: putative capsid protein [Circoviridae sp.]|nr:MAG: putative capsid protein [Circoviridae sp.]